MIRLHVVLLLLMACLSNACVPPYKPPRADQPHAVLKLRRSYEKVAGVSLAEVVDIDEHSALRDVVPSAIAESPRTGAILVHPVPGDFVVRSNFFHLETHLVTESYQEPTTTYSTESYSCGSNTCSRTVSHTTYQTRWRTVNKTVEVSDGGCARGMRFGPQDGHVYLLQYTYQAPAVCALSCFEQVRSQDGSFRNDNCPAAPPEK
jgi:hypothetical protein